MQEDLGLRTIEQISCCEDTVNKKGEEWLAGSITTPVGEIPVVSTELSKKDVTGRWKVRWGIGRMKYTINPGLYAVGNPGSSSPVFVSANYKMSFDYLRKDLKGIDGWILILDTKGINVWCAAGKGTFGTGELVERIIQTRLNEIVNHRELIVPQLGAPGVAAHKVKKTSGFNVNYGPVLSKDIPEYLENNKRASEKMRRVPFSLKDRAALIPMELIPSLKLIPYIFFFLIVAQLINYGSFNVKDLLLLLPFIGAILMGTVVFQLLLPWVPFRSFVIKGWLIGLVWSHIVFTTMSFESWQAIGWYFVLPPITSFLAENFTGATTFTHLSGVKLELKYGVPVMLLSLLIGVLLQFI
ncbi:mercury methylation corrinoid protein HgcA [Thermodesulfobacteriota bacterium]